MTTRKAQPEFLVTGVIFQADYVAPKTSNEIGWNNFFKFSDVVNIFLEGRGIETFRPGVDV